ncbi:hypothetical protein A9Q99_13120 [Gammaproteobacteria bacterium 45_16_T64]|nr:hypothetical protein A9Q99_13120 [Gammaproteobacteria bacterium 45_16_T64]
MTALIIVDLTPIDKEALTTYSALAAETLSAFGGEFLAKGGIIALHGDSAFSTKVVIQFPSHQHANDWYHSDAYQKIIPTRNKGMDSQFHLIG